MNKNNIGAIFHELTKRKSVNSFLVNTSPENENYFYKKYDRFIKVELPNPLHHLNVNLTEVVKEKELNKNFSGESVTLAELSNLLFYSFGITRKAFTAKLSRRAYTSISGRHSLEIYILNFNIETLKHHLYHYNIEDHYLEMLWSNNKLTNNSVNHIFPKPSINGASGAILITAQALNMVSIFSSLGYKYIYFEAGAVAENINLVAGIQKLSVAVVEEIDEEAVEKFLDIDGEQEVLILSLLLGKK